MVGGALLDCLHQCLIEACGPFGITGVQRERIVREPSLQFPIGSDSQKDVLGLQVSVDETMRVQLAQASQNLAAEVDGSLACQTPPGLEREMLPERQRLPLSVAAEVGDDEGILVLQVNGHASREASVFQAGARCHGFPGFGGQCILDRRQELDGDVLTRLPVPPAVHDTSDSLPQLAAQVEPSTENLRHRCGSFAHEAIRSASISTSRR